MSALEGLGLARNSNQSWKRLPKRRSRTDLRSNADCITRNIQGFCNELGAGFAAAPYRAPIQTANLPQPKVISRVETNRDRTPVSAPGHLQTTKKKQPAAGRTPTRGCHFRSGPGSRTAII